MLVFVFPHVFVIVFAFSIFSMTSMACSQSCHIPWHVTYTNNVGAINASRVNGGRFVLGINIRQLNVRWHLTNKMLGPSSIH